MKKISKVFLVTYDIPAKHNDVAQALPEVLEVQFSAKRIQKSVWAFKSIGDDKDERFFEEEIREWVEADADDDIKIFQVRQTPEIKKLELKPLVWI